MSKRGGGGGGGGGRLWRRDGGEGVGGEGEQKGEGKQMVKISKR